MNNIKNSWERRSKIFGDKKEAVMHQSFPPVLNDYIHQIHTQELIRYLPNGKCICLDVGCGYGRLATEIINKNKTAQVFGIDISKTFVKLFNNKLKNKGKAVAGDIRDIPYEKNKFDLVYCVVTLMYLEKPKQQKKAIGEILRVLKPGGTAVIIEPNSTGIQIINLFGFIPFILRKIFRKKKVETFGTSFPWKRIDKLIYDSGGKLIVKKGHTFFTLLFIPILTLAKISPRNAKYFLGLIYKLDTALNSAYFSHVITYIILKP